MIESSRFPSLTGLRAPALGRRGDLGRRRETGPPPGLDAAVEDVEARLRESIEAQQPVGADGLSIEADVVVEDDPVAIADAPPAQDGLGLLGGRDQPLALGVARLGRGAAQGHLPMEVAVDGAWDVALVVDAPVRGDMDDPQIGVVEVGGQPVGADERAWGLGGGGLRAGSLRGGACGTFGRAHGADASSRAARRVRSGR